MSFNKGMSVDRNNIPEQLNSFSVSELSSIMNKLGIGIPRKATKKKMIKQLLKPLREKVCKKSDRKICQEIAFKTILKNKRKNLRLLAGTSLYSDMWTRDAFITSLGLLAHDKYLDLIKQVLKVQAKNLRKDGLVPLRIGRESYTTQWLFGIPSGKDNVPVYKDDKAGSEPTDSNPQFIILAWLYLKHTGDKEFIKSISKSLKKCQKYLCDTSKGYLLQGKYFHSWYDTFTFNGPDLFSNVLFVYCVKCYQKISEQISEVNYDGICKFNYTKVLQTFKKAFWNGRYLKISPDIKVMETAGNSLAVLFGILSKSEAKKFITYLERNKSKKSQISPVTVPKMSIMHLYWPAAVVGLQGYHNDRLWLWPHCVYSKARQKVGLDSKLESLEKSIVKHQTFYETVDDELNPIKHPIQSTEENFSESCGSYLLAIGGDPF